jgi:Na+/proline symporter
MNNSQPQAKIVYVNQSKILLILGIVLLGLILSYLKFSEKSVHYSTYLLFVASVIAISFIGGLVLKRLTRFLLYKRLRSRSLVSFLLFLEFQGRFPIAFLGGVFLSYLLFHFVGLV